MRKALRVREREVNYYVTREGRTQKGSKKYVLGFLYSQSD